MSDGLKSVKAALDLTGRVAIITGGAGLLGRKHAEAIAEMGGIPVLVDLRGDQEEASATLGSSWWQTFWRITLPSIKWGLMYGIVLTVARTLGEFGAVIMVSSNLPGTSQTLTLLVADRYNRGAEYGAYAVSTLLMAVAVIVLVVQVILDARRAKTDN